MDDKELETKRIEYFGFIADLNKRIAHLEKMREQTIQSTIKDCKFSNFNALINTYLRWEHKEGECREHTSTISPDSY